MLHKIATYTAKLVWLWIEREGKSTPAEIVDRVGMKRRTVMDALAELRAGGYVIRLSAGLYCAASRTDDAADRTEHAASRPESAGHRTCAASRTPDCAATRTDDAASRTGDAQRNINKQNKTKEKKDFSEKSENTVRCTDRLADFVDLNSEPFIAARIAVGKIFLERGVSPDLLDRIAAANILGLPGCDPQMLKLINEDAFEAVAEGRVSRRWMHVANWIRKVFEAAGWEWTKCRTEKEKQIQELNRVRAAKAAAAALAAESAEPEITHEGKIVRKCSHRETVRDEGEKLAAGFEKVRQAVTGVKPKKKAKSA